jgi:hypothetical protein
VIKSRDATQGLGCDVGGAGALVVACDASGIGVEGGGWFAGAVFVADVSDTAAGALFTLVELFVDAAGVVSLCWLHPLSANTTKAQAIAV